MACNLPADKIESRAGMAELADAADSKSAEVHPSWGFNSPSRHHLSSSKHNTGARLVDRFGSSRWDRKRFIVPRLCTTHGIVTCGVLLLLLCSFRSFLFGCL